MIPISPLERLKAVLTAGKGNNADAPPHAAPPQADSRTPVNNATPLESKTQAGYATDGPFYCGRCEHFIRPGRCNQVEGPIREQDCCNLFDSGKKNHALAQSPTDNDALPSRDEPQGK